MALGQRAHGAVLVAQWNDPSGVDRIFAQSGGDIACVICEPMLCNSGCIPPEPGFLQYLREVTAKHGALLIFDEVITGFRLALDGAQGYYGVTPDLATFAKAIGGGTPLSALAGAGRHMNLVADGAVVHAGTLNGNPLALAAARATIDVLSEDPQSTYGRLRALGERLRTGLEQVVRTAGRPVVTSGGGPVFQLSMMSETARCYRDTLRSDTASYSDFVLALLDEGVSILPDGRWYLSTAHSAEDVDRTLAAAHRAADVLT